MKKIIIAAAYAAIILSLAAGCNKKDDKPLPTAEIKTEVTDMPKASDTPDILDKSSIARIEKPDTESEIDTKNVEKDFSGVWRAVSTTSENVSFEAMETEIHYSGYSVSMTFSDSSYNTRKEGSYKIKDGILYFDDNFEDCTAYFYDDNDSVLVIDNGASLVFCEKQDLEEEMH